jgi:hypothetical protein
VQWAGKACLVDRPEYGLVKGQMGVILEEFQKPTHAYQVEFVAEDGSTIAEFAVAPDQIEPWNA